MGRETDMTAELGSRRLRRSPLLPVVVLACLAGATVDAPAIQGEEVTTCASYKLEEPGGDECFGAIGERATVSRRGVVRLRLYCMEDPGDRCTGQYEVPWIRRAGERGFYRIKRRGSFAIDAGPEGGPVEYKLSSNPRIARRRARALRRDGGVMLIIIGTLQPSGKIETTSVDEIDVRRR